MDGENHSMTDWKTILAGADDEYLAGLSNKGTVKRAHKDRETTPCEILDTGDQGINVKLGEEELLIAPVLAESRCSCPSRSICRHIVQAILVLKDMYEAGEGGIKEEKKEKSEALPSEELWQAVLGIGNQKIIRALGMKKLGEVLGQIRAGKRADIARSSTVLVKLPDSELQVKFLLPLEYSSCTCKKKEFCAHRAAAALWCRMEAGTLRLEEFEKEEEEPKADLNRIREKAGEMKAALEDILASGLSRTASQSADTLERLAVISHNEGLASFEDAFRSLQNGYEVYFSRSSSVNAAGLMDESARLYEQICRLSRVKTDGELRNLGGVFHMDYEPAGDMELIGITAEAFQSRNGYQGETVYFLEKNTKKWYTYTSARPVYYDSRGRRGQMEKAAAPWGLNVSLEELAGTEVCLKQAKAGKTGRLSSSQDAKGMITGKHSFCPEDAGKWLYKDFGALFKEQCFLKNSWLKREEETLRIVCVQAAAWDAARFSQAEQKFSMAVFDSNGKELLTEMAYSRREDANIRYLERIADQVEKGEIPIPAIAGKLYLKDGKMILHPLEIFQWGQEAGKREAFADEWVSDSPQERERVLKINAMEQMYRLLEEVSQQIEDLYQSGFDAVHDSTLGMLRQWAERAGESGLAFLGIQLGKLCREIEGCRHSLHPVHGAELEIYANIAEYLWLARRKTEFDLAEAYYTQ